MGRNAVLQGVFCLRSEVRWNEGEICAARLLVWVYQRHHFFFPWGTRELLLQGGFSASHIRAQIHLGPLLLFITLYWCKYVILSFLFIVICVNVCVWNENYKLSWKETASKGFPALTFHYQLYCSFLFNNYPEIECARVWHYTNKCHREQYIWFQ